LEISGSREKKDLKSYASKIGQVKKRREEVTRKWRGSKTGGSKETR
jgi:hypothetical protein